MRIILFVSVFKKIILEEFVETLMKNVALTNINLYQVVINKYKYNIFN